MLSFLLAMACSNGDSSQKAGAANVSGDALDSSLSVELEGVKDALRHPLKAGDVGEPLRWSLSPGCALKYEYRASSSPIVSLNREKKVEAKYSHKGKMTLKRPPRSDFEMKYGTVHVVESRGGQSQQQSTPPDKLQATLLNCNKDCAGFEEVDGPTDMWLNGGLFPGVGVFFPPYPREGKVDSKSTWLFSSKGAELKGSVDSPAPQDLRYDNKGNVRVHQWLQSNQLPIAWLKAEWTHGSETKHIEFKEKIGSVLFPIKALSYGRYSGDYLVTGDGRLLWAKIEGTMVTETGLLMNSGRSSSSKQLSKVLPEEFKFENKISGEVRLVTSCDSNDTYMNGFSASK